MCRRAQIHIFHYRGAQSVMKSKNSPAHLNKLRNFDPAKQSLRNQGGDGKYYMSRDARKPVFGVSDQVRHKPACTVTKTG